MRRAQNHRSLTILIAFKCQHDLILIYVSVKHIFILPSTLTRSYPSVKSASMSSSFFGKRNHLFTAASSWHPLESCQLDTHCHNRLVPAFFTIFHPCQGRAGYLSSSIYISCNSICLFPAIAVILSLPPASNAAVRIASTHFAVLCVC